MHKVFVYGSLLSGMGNHPLIKDSTKLGETRTPKGFGMMDLGYFPGAIQSEKLIDGTLIGEVYEVDDNTLKRLDQLEGYNSITPAYGLYNRIEIDTEFGKAFIYIYNNRYGRLSNLVLNGDWRTHYTNKMTR